MRMTLQQKKLWERITKEVREAGMDNLRARELYDELSKLINMSDKVLLSITEQGEGLEVRIADATYGNLAVVGLLEKIKLNILEGLPEEKEEVLTNTKQKYDA
jgi:hypothetical protein